MTWTMALVLDTTTRIFRKKNNTQRVSNSGIVGILDQNKNLALECAMAGIARI